MQFKYMTNFEWRVEAENRLRVEFDAPWTDLRCNLVSWFMRRGDASEIPHHVADLERRLKGFEDAYDRSVRFEAARDEVARIMRRAAREIAEVVGGGHVYELGLRDEDDEQFYDPTLAVYSNAEEG